MKNRKQKITLVLFLCLLILIGTTILSKLSQQHQQTLPAIVRSNKVVISALTDGTLISNEVMLNDKVKKGQLLARFESEKIQAQYQGMLTIQDYYKTMLTSAKHGDLLSLESGEIQQKIDNEKIERQELEAKIRQNKQALIFMRKEQSSEQKIFEAYNKLYKKGTLPEIEYQKELEKWQAIKADFFETHADSTLLVERLKIANKKIKFLQHEKKLIENNVSLISEKWLLELEEIKIKIADVKSKIDNLDIYAPIDGVITDRHVNIGEYTKDGKEIFDLAIDDNIWIIAYGNSFSKENIEAGQIVDVFCNNKKILKGKVASFSPIMEKVKSLSNAFETVNTYTKIEIQLEDQNHAKQYLTPGERLFVKIYYK